MDTTAEELVDKLTVEELVADEVFVALCNTWQAERHCPLVMPDYLRDRGCDRAAMVATWAVNHTTTSLERLRPSSLTGGFFFCREYSKYDYENGLRDTDTLPWHKRKDSESYTLLLFHHCIADFLLNADPVALFTLAPPKAEYSVIDNGGMLVAVN